MSIINTCDEVEKSPNERASCRACGKKIGRGTPRVKFVKEYGNNYSDAYYCYRCGKGKLNDDIKMLKKEIEDTQELKKEFKELLKNSKKEILLANL